MLTSWTDDNDDILIIQKRKPITIYPVLRPPSFITTRSKDDIKLVNEWSFYLQYKFNKKSKQNFSSCNNLVGSVDTINQFWDFVDNFPLPSNVFCLLLPNGIIELSYHNQKRVEAFCLFRNNILPIWEDPINTLGGHYEFTGDFTLDELDSLWKKTILLLIGGVLYNVTGIRVVDKTIDYRGIIQYRFEIWMDTRNDSLIKVFNRQFIRNTLEWEWKCHSTTLL